MHQPNSLLLDYVDFETGFTCCSELAEWEWAGIGSPAIPTGTPFFWRLFHCCFSSHFQLFKFQNCFYLSDKIWTTNGCENIKYPPCLQGRLSGSVWIVCPARDGLCRVSIPDMKMADELTDELYRVDLSAWLWDSVPRILPFPVPAAEPVKELELLGPSLFGYSGTLGLNSWKGHLVSPYRALARLAAPQSWRIKAQPPLLGSAWQVWVPVAELFLQEPQNFSLNSPSVTHSVFRALHGSLGLNISPWKLRTPFSNVTSVIFGLWCLSANESWEALPFSDVLHQFHWILQILSLTDEVLIWTSN